MCVIDIENVKIFCHTLVLDCFLILYWNAEYDVYTVQAYKFMSY